MVVGKPVQVSDAEDRVTGRIAYVTNLELPGLLHARLLRSPLAHARLRNVDPSRAERLPGVLAVLTGAELARTPNLRPYFGPVVPDQPILAIDRVRFVGEPVAAVAALDEETAAEALKLIEIEYDELPAVFDALEALEAGAPVLHEASEPWRSLSGTAPDLSQPPNTCATFRWQSGDLERALGDAGELFDDTFVAPATQHVPLEPHACLASWERGRLIVRAATQTPHLVRAQLAAVFGLPLSHVRVMVPMLGGGYGAKAYPKLEPITAALAWKAERPVRLALTRAETFVTVIAHPARIRLRTGVARDGRFLAREVEAHWNTGAYGDAGPRLPYYGGFCGLGPYRFESVRIASTAVYTNLPPAGAFRGYMADHACWAHERQTDLIAHRLGLDPLELRLKNLLSPADAFATGERMNDARWREVLDEAARGIRWDAPPAADEPGPRRRGRGVAVSLMPTITPSTSSALVKLNADGSATLLSSTVEMGQGAHTVLAQIAAEVLGLPIERVAAAEPDTDTTPFDLTTTASRSTAYMGQAVRMAAEDVRAQLLTLAAGLFEVAVGDLVLQDGSVEVRGLPGKRLTFDDVLRQGGLGDLTGRGTARATGGWSGQVGQGRLSAQWHQGAVGAEVAVDVETGAIEVEQLHLVAWSGRVVHPVLASLQNEGNAAFGIGQALFEELVFDDGHLTNATLADYMVPSFEDLPPRLSTAELEAAEAEAEIHGLGETTLPPVAPAIANAIQDATGLSLHQLPITPERVLEGWLRRDGGAGKE